MYRLLTITLLPLLVCSCGRDPLSIQEVSIDAEPPGDGMEAMAIDAATGEILPAHEDLTFRLSYHLGEDAGAKISLQDRYTLDLGTLNLAGNEPRMEGELSKEIWHDLEVVFAAGTKNSPPIMLELYVDGNLMHYQVALPDEDTRPGPLTLASTGDAEFKNFRYAAKAGSGSFLNAAGEVVLSIPILAYQSYALAPQTADFRAWETTEPDRSGYVGRFHVTANRPGSEAYAIRYAGQLDVPKGGTYKWRIWGPTAARLYIDGKEILAKTGKPEFNDDTALDLEEGTYDVVLEYINRGGWHPIDVAYQYEDQEERYLNTMEREKQISSPGNGQPVVVKADERPYILRSFMYFPTPKVYTEARKRTHVVSVGEGKGPHYSIDLQTGGLLQMWRGEFADVQEMWVGRGESQVMRPLGPAVSFDGAMQWTDDPDAAWPIQPEEPDEDAFQHEVYELDDAGRPTFTYTFGSGRVSDKITPNGDGLTRELTYTGADADGYTPLAVADEITEVAPGEFVLRGPGVRIKIESYNGDGLFKQVGGGKERLIAHVGNEGSLRYSMNW